MSLVIQSINRPFSPAHIYPSSFCLLCFIPTFITKTPTIHYQNTCYSLSRRSLFIIKTSIIDYTRSLPHLYHTHKKQGTSPNLSLAINYHLKIKRFFLSHLTLSFSTQSAFRERIFIINLKYFQQIYLPKIWLREDSPWIDNLSLPT